MMFDTLSLGRVTDSFGQQRTDGIGDRNMRDATGPEKRFLARKRPVYELIDDDEVSGLIFFFQRSARR